MTDIDKAAQEAWKQIRSDPSLNLTVEASYFRTGFRAGAEWRDKQRPGKTEALEALERLAEIPGVSATDLRPIRQFIERRALTSERGVPEGCPKIVCLCGSTKFRAAFEEANLQETLAGNIVLSVGGYPHHDGGRIKELVYGLGKEQVKPDLDRLHFRKIELADEILVLNVGGYIGQSTSNEIRHAEKLDKTIRYLEPTTEPEEDE